MSVEYYNDKKHKGFFSAVALMFLGVATVIVAVIGAIIVVISSLRELIRGL